MSRRLLVALLLLLAVALAWILRGTEPGRQPDGTDAAEFGAATGETPPVSSDVERDELRTDEGRSEAAAAPAEGGGWVLRGTVWSERGEPVPKQTVRLVSGVSSGWGVGAAINLMRSRPDFAAAETDAQGRYLIRLSGPPAANHRDWQRNLPGLLCDPSAGRPAMRALSTGFMFHGGTCDLVLRAGICVTGRILAPDGAPAAFCRIQLPGSLWSTDENGRFRLPAPAQKDFELRIHHDLGVLRLPGLQALPGQDLDLGDLTLRGSGQLAGRLILPDGSPAPQVRLSFTARAQLDMRDPDPNGDWSDDGRLAAWTITDAAGAFRVQGLTLDDHASACHAMGAVIPLHPQGGATEGTSWLRAGAAAEGHLLILPWRMLLVDAPDFDSGMSTLLYEVHGSAAPGSDPPDSSTFRKLTGGYANPEDLPVVVLYDSATWMRITGVSGTQAAGSALVPVPSEPWLTRASLPLDPVAGTGRIVVRAADAAGEPIRRLKLDLRDPRTGQAVLGVWQSNAAGGAEIRNAPAGVWSLTMSSASEDFDNYAQPETVTVEVRAGDVRELEWRPRSGGRLQIVVNLGGSTVLPADPPAIRATVLAGPGHVGNLLNLVEDGKQRQRAPKPSFPPATVMVVAGVLEPGTYRIRFDADGYAAAEAAVEVLASDIARLVAVLDAAPQAAPEN